MSSVEFILNDNTRIPWLGFGTGTALYKKDAAELVRQAIDSGITHFDGAQLYENEESLGEGVKLSGKPRSELFVTTKLRLRLEAGQTVKDTLLQSLKKLGMEYVDLFLVHDPTPQRKEGKLKELWKQMEALKTEGLARSIGVSNFAVKDLEEILPEATIIPSINQIELHPYVWKAAKPIVEFCRKHDIKIASYGGLTPLARAPTGPLKDVLPTIRSRLEQTRGAPVTEGQVLTKWILQKNAVVVTTSSKVSRMREYLDAGNVPDLTEDEVESIEQAGSQLHKRIFMQQAFDE